LLGFRATYKGAFQKITHAIRIAQLEGMHTQLPEEVLGVATVARCRNLWWSLYIIDHHFSPSLGLPITTRDRDITALTNTGKNLDSGNRDLIFDLQIRLTRMLSSIMSCKSCVPPQFYCQISHHQSRLWIRKNPAWSLSGDNTQHLRDYG
jgi:hypothetical protein